jgi:hypothetical protein
MSRVEELKAQLVEVASRYLMNSSRATDAMATGDTSRALIHHMAADKNFHIVLQLQKQIHSLQADGADQNLRLVH